MAVNQEIVTADQLLAMGDIGRCELVEGELVRLDLNGFKHGAAAMHVGSLIAQHADRHNLGVTTAAETGFRIGRNPDTVRAPDVGFVCADRARGQSRRGLFEGAPDFAVEVVSPDDRRRDVTAKAAAWLRAGCRMVWIVDPRQRTVTTRTAPDQSRVFTDQDVLDAGDVVLGLRLAVQDLFPSLAE